MPLTDIACRAAKPKNMVYKLSDAGGLCLRVVPAGGKYWTFRYRYGGKQKDLSLGVYPALSLQCARSKRDTAKQSLCEGVDPAIIKITQRINTSISTDNDFGSIAKEWVKMKRHHLSPRFADQIESRLKADALPKLGKLPIGSITTPMVLSVLRKVQVRGAIETMHRLKQYCSMIFRYAIAAGIIDRDPCADLNGALPTARKNNFAAIDASDLPGLLRKLSDNDVSMGFQTRLAMRFLMLTFVRTGELIGARWAEIDIDNALWTIPAQRMKMRRDHIVPLSKQSIAILKTLRMLSAGEFVFPGHHGWNKPISNMTILKGLERMGYKGRMTGHGFRALATTTLREVLEFPFDLIDIQLAHAPANKVKAAYDRAKFLKQRTVMMQRWADYLDEMEKLAR